MEALGETRNIYAPIFLMIYPYAYNIMVPTSWPGWLRAVVFNTQVHGASSGPHGSWHAVSPLAKLIHVVYHECPIDMYYISLFV